MKKIFLIHSLSIAILSPLSYAQPLHPSSSMGAISSTPGSASQNNIGQTSLPNKQNNAAGTYAPAPTQKKEQLESYKPASYSTTSSAASSTPQQNPNTTSTKATTLSEVKDVGVGSLIDANMEEESTKLKALQTQQQLAIQSLSIANSSSSNVITATDK
ncbi:hypothetical protein AOC19_03020 [Polynucleobacter asymbioticus]|uniref:flagellin n=1 Tax=Polynucleobacter asymbioticus TaxID=576611 RepID=UPI001BFDC2C9|nr:flagellin [Polynucleobacter asymbioticus]QWD85857.1 hypothetical protein AOC19_03020 [Polynucleobacter asymbioticus]